MPRFLAAEGLANGSLTIWGTVVDHPLEVWVLHTSQKLVSSKVKAFMEFLIATFPDASWPMVMGKTKTTNVRFQASNR